MNRMRLALLAMTATMGGTLAGIIRADAPQSQDWFRNQNQPLTPPPPPNQNGGADFGQTGGPPPPPMNQGPGPGRMIPSGPNANVSDFPQDPVHDWVVAHARYAYSRAMFHRAEKELNDSVRSAQLNFEQSKDFGDATAAEKQAYDAYTAERQKALQSVMSDPKYLAAIQLRDDTSHQLAALRARSKGAVAPELVLATASLKLQYSSDAHAMEVAALEKDDALKDARRKMVDAAAKVSALRTSFDASVRNNPQLLQARRNLEDARVALITSEAYMNAASVAGGIATDYSYYRHRWDGLANGGGYGWNWTPYGY